MMRHGSLQERDIGALVALVEQARLGEAEQRTRALLMLHPDAGMLWKIFSVALAGQGKDAVPALRKTAELMPQDAEAHRNLGTALYDAAQWAPALASLRRAIALQPAHAATLVDAANAMRELGMVREALPLYRRALALEPGLTEAHNNMGNAWLALSQHADAAECYRRALALKPDDAQILCNLGLALRLQGSWPEALEHTRRAIAADPRLALAHNNLGLTLAALGRREEALLSYAQALALAPRYVDALNNMGNALSDLGRRREAAAQYARAIEADPQHPEGHCNLGQALFGLNRVDEAIAAYRHALQLRPKFVAAHLSLATALRHQRRAADAEAACSAALAIAPASVEALCLLGELRADRGKFAEAQQLFERCLAQNPDYPAALVGAAMHRRMAQGDHAWLENAQRLLSSGALRPEQEIALGHALGKYFDDVQEYDQAFAQYRRANELSKRLVAAYDPAKFTERVDRIIGSMDEAFLRRPQGHGSDSELPVFVVGMPRSGTSLTEQILASHPAVFGAGEVSYWDGAFAANGAMLPPGLAADYLGRLRALSGGRTLRVIDKMPANFMYAGLIHAAFPRARFIHMRRHPIDTALSIYFQNFSQVGAYANDMNHLAHYYRGYVRLTDHWRALLPAAAWLEVPYEALIADQEGWTRRMLDFIGLPWDARCLDFHRTERVVLTASKWQVRQKINAASAGRWRHYAKFIGPLRDLAPEAS